MPFQPAIDEPSNAWPDLELVRRELLGRHGDVLLLAAGIGEAEVDELDLLVLDHLEDVGGGCHASLLVGTARHGLRCIAKRAREMSENYAITRGTKASAGSNVPVATVSRRFRTILAQSYRSQP